MADDALTAAITRALGIHRLHAALNICTGCAWRATPNVGSLLDQHEQHRAEQVAQVVREHTAAKQAEAWGRAADVVRAHAPCGTDPLEPHRVVCDCGIDTADHVAHVARMLDLRAERLHPEPAPEGGER